MDDVTLGKMLTDAHRGQVDYCEPEGMSVSQSSLSVVFERAGKPVGEKCRSISKFRCHTFSEDIPTVRMVDRSGQPDERNSSNAKIRTLLEEQRQKNIALFSAAICGEVATGRQSGDGVGLIVCVRRQ